MILRVLCLPGGTGETLVCLLEGEGEDQDED